MWKEAKVDVSNEKNNENGKQRVNFEQKQTLKFAVSRSFEKFCFFIQ